MARFIPSGPSRKAGPRSVRPLALAPSGLALTRIRRGMVAKIITLGDIQRGREPKPQKRK